MATEAKKILQAHREGLNIGLQQGADIMRERVLALGLPQEIAAKVAAIQINEVKK